MNDVLQEASRQGPSVAFVVATLVGLAVLLGGLAIAIVKIVKMFKEAVSEFNAQLEKREVQWREEKRDEREHLQGIYEKTGEHFSRAIDKFESATEEGRKHRELTERLVTELTGPTKAINIGGKS